MVTFNWHRWSHTGISIKIEVKAKLVFLFDALILNLNLLNNKLFLGFLRSVKVEDLRILGLGFFVGIFYLAIIVTLFIIFFKFES